MAGIGRHSFCILEEEEGGKKKYKKKKSQDRGGLSVASYQDREDNS